MTERSAELKLHNGKGIAHLPLLEGTMGPPALAINTLYKDNGLLAYDPGFRATASCRSAITYVDGEAGVLLYRGYPIQDLAEHSNFIEVAHLLMCGSLPDDQELADFTRLVHEHSLVHEQVFDFYRGFGRAAHPMAVMVGVVGALSAFYHDVMDLRNQDDRELAAIRLIAKMPTIAARAYTYNIGRPPRYPDDRLDYAANFMQMMFGMPSRDYDVDPVLARALDRILVLHADHEQNASTSTVRLAASSGANPFACIAAGIASLWGPAHGGANEAVVNMLQQIGRVEKIPEFIDRAKDKDDPFRLMGFGHRIYKSKDPRAKVIHATTQEVLGHLGIDDPLLEVAMRLEEIALKDEYFLQRKLYPNVDFYSGILLRAMGLPLHMFTVMFATARTAGWVSHWLELHQDPDGIGRPRQLYVGHPERPYPAERRRTS